MARKRPIKRLLPEFEPNYGKAQVVDSPSQLSHVMFVASRGKLGRRNVAIMWMLFGSALRINEVAKLKISDIYHPNGELKDTFKIPGKYTKTGKARIVFIRVPQQRTALHEWFKQRLNENAMLSQDKKYGGLSGNSPVFLSKKGTWRTFAFNAKKYNTENGVKETMVCSSLENLIRDLIKSAGVQNGSSHSGRRSLATILRKKGHELEFIQEILGHSDSEITLGYLDHSNKRIDEAFNKIWKGVKLPNFRDNLVYEK